MHAQNFLATLDIRARHNHAAIKSSGTQQRRIEYIGPVRRSDQNYAFVGFKSVHLHQQGVEGLLAFVMPAAETCASMPAHRIYFINKNDARSVLLSLLEKIAHAAGANAHEHFDEIRSGDRKERNVCFSRDGSRQQGFARSRRAHQQNALRYSPAQFLKSLRVFQELDNFLQFFLGFVGAGDIFKRGLFLLRREQARARFSKAQSLVSARLHLPHHEYPEPH